MHHQHVRCATAVRGPKGCAHLGEGERRAGQRGRIQTQTTRLASATPDVVVSLEGLAQLHDVVGRLRIDFSCPVANDVPQVHLLLISEDRAPWGPISDRFGGFTVARLFESVANLFHMSGAHKHGAHPFYRNDSLGPKFHDWTLPHLYGRFRSLKKVIRGRPRALERVGSGCRLIRPICSTHANSCVGL